MHLFLKKMVSEVKVSENEYIMGQTILLPDQMEQFVQIVNPAAIELANFYVNLGNDYGMRGDIAFAQAILETDYFRFTGVVKSHQNNFCGLGSTGPDNPGASFDTPQKECSLICSIYSPMRKQIHYPISIH